MKYSIRPVQGRVVLAIDVCRAVLPQEARELGSALVAAAWAAEQNDSPEWEVKGTSPEGLVLVGQKSTTRWFKLAKFNHPDKCHLADNRSLR